MAKRLGLTDEQTEKLVEAYSAARDRQTTAANAVSGPAARPDTQKMSEINQVERAAFETALKGFLNPEQVDAACLTLGSFFRRWDAMVEVLDGMELTRESRERALTLTADYVSEWNKAMSAATASGRTDSMREQAEALKSKLDAGLADILSRQQMATWNDATAKQGPRRR